MAGTWGQLVPHILKRFGTCEGCTEEDLKREADLVKAALLDAWKATGGGHAGCTKCTDVFIGKVAERAPYAKDGNPQGKKSPAGFTWRRYHLQCMTIETYVKKGPSPEGPFGRHVATRLVSTCKPGMAVIIDFWWWKRSLAEGLGRDHDPDRLEDPKTLVWFTPKEWEGGLNGFPGELEQP